MGPTAAVLFTDKNSALVAEICDRLDRFFPLDSLGNPPDPLDDLVFVILSNRSSPSRVARTFLDLKATYKRWEDLLADDGASLADTIASLGLAGVKSRQIMGILRRLQGDLGTVSLDPLRSQSTRAAEEYLVSLPGVSTKVARCVLLFAFDRDVLPVDAHVHRVSYRLGLPVRSRADASHEPLDAVVPTGMRRTFHIRAIQLGRSICRRRPLCESCPLASCCPTALSL